MKSMVPKKMVVFYIMLVLTCSFFIPTGTFAAGENEFNSLAISVNQQGDEIEINYEINSFDEIPVIINGVEYSVIKIGEESNLLFAGKPDIPSICRSIMIPDMAKMEIEIISADYQEFDNILIAPSKGNLLRSVNPDDVPFEFGEVYFEDAFFPGELASLREPYIIRDFRGQVVDLYPVQYNPVKKTMRFYNNIKLKVYPIGTDIINTIQRDSLPEKIDSNFKIIYEDRFINYGMNGRYDPVEEQGNMLIITYDEFRDNLQTYIDWKVLRGIPTEVVKVSTIGNANAIKEYISNYYTEHGLTFVLLVGDAAQVPTLTAGYAASDPSYTYIVGNDHYPDLFIGRFSAQTSEQLQTMVQRSLDYEKNPQIGAEWYHKGIGVASNQGPGDDGETDDEHMDNIREKLLGYTYTEVERSYDYWGTTEIIANAINAGLSIANYCGHGSPTAWGNGGGFSNSDVHNLVNDNMIPFVTSVACNNGQFDDYDECFCEAWLRATNDETDEPTGAIASTGSTVSMSWSPPMDAQDEFIDLIVETWEDNVKHTIGGIHYNGVMHMNDEYGASGYSETDYWTVFGDPSILIRTDEPSEINAEHSSYIDLKTLSLEVTVDGVSGALCSISRNNELFGSAYTDEDGYALIQLDGSFHGTEPVDLLITAYNKIPYTAEILVNTEPAIPNKPDGPETGQPHKEYTYTTSTIDDEGDQVFYQWSWGDGYYSEWKGPYNSGETVSTTYKWSKEATYFVKVKAKDIYDLETDWSEQLTIRIEKSRSANNLLSFRFIDNLMNLFPNLLPILRLIIQLS